MISRETEELDNRQRKFVERNASFRESDCNCHIELERPRKRVRISCEEPEVHRYVVPNGTRIIKCSEGEIKSNRTWLTRQELGYFRSCAKKLCRVLRLDDVLRDAYSRANKVEPCTPSHLIADHLAENDGYVAQRGLERWSSSQHALVRSVKVVEVKTAVFLEQTNQMLSGKRNPLRLAKVSEEASRSSRKFAEVLASADERVALQVRQETSS